MTAQHTPGLLRLERSDRENTEGWYITRAGPGHNEAVYHVGDDDGLRDDTDGADIQHLVDCWNACEEAGIEPKTVGTWKKLLAELAGLTPDQGTFPRIQLAGIRDAARAVLAEKPDNERTTP